MTTTDSFTSRLTPPTLAPSTTIYRDTPQPLPQRSVARSFRPSTRALALPDERISDGLLLGMAAMMVPAVLYSIAQALDLIAGGSLDQAVRAFVP